MENLIERLMEETVKFLEICQNSAIYGKLNPESYYSLTRLKFDFIENIMESEKYRLYIDDSLKERIDKLHSENSVILNSNKKIAGK